MRIYLVQHGLAKGQDEDPLRPLADQGLEDITRVAGFLSLFEKPQPQVVMHSAKLRSKQTAEMFAQAWRIAQIQESKSLSPHAEPSLWASRLKEMNKDVLLVGHLPHLSKLASLLVCGDADREVVQFRNAGVLCLEKDEANCKVLWQINPTLFYGED